VSPTPGLIAQMTGKLTTKRYKYATIYVDQYSRYSFCYLQKTATAEETIEGKKAFEQVCKNNGVKVEAYHADNGVFRANDFVKHCRDAGQSLTFAAAGAHHSNGMAERRIRILQELARAQMIHANRRWPQAITAHLWPYALRTANEVLNETPSLQSPERYTPMQIFTNTQVNTNSKHWLPFGCPVYVLENSLQSGHGIHHKWKARARVGIYLGRSPQHGRNVALVLSRTTGLVSPQFHVTFDPSFHTVKQDSLDVLWQIKAGFVTQQKPADSGASKREMIWPEGAPATKKRKPEATPERVTQDSRTDDPQLQQPDGNSPHQDNTSNPPLTNNIQNESPERNSEPAQRLIEVMMAELTQATDGDVPGEIFCLQAMFPNYAGEMEPDPLTVLKATTDPDTMYWHEAMKEDDKSEFVTAMKKEWDDQISNGNFTVTHKSEVPKDALILPAVWQMKRKRDIKTRAIKKYKARLNIDGSRMKPGIHYDQTYAPVASWNSIRTLLTMTALHNWKTKQIDYVLAFPQAPVERTIYMKIPKGFQIEDGKTEDYVLELHRNVYGQKQSGRVWYKYLTERLIKRVGFTQSKVDECVFYRGKVMYVLYTDDSILAGPDEAEIDKVIEDIKQAGLDITIEGDLQDFLGINIDRKEDGSIHLTQPHLIDQILKDL
jgi:hypothetical protein